MSTVITTGDEISHDEAFLAWLCDQGVEPDLTFKVEVKRDHMKVHQYALNKQGAKFFDQAADEVAYRLPFTVPISESPPVGSKRPDTSDPEQRG